MSMGDLDKTDPRRLARMLGLDAATEDWRYSELGAILRHQLSMRMEVGLHDQKQSPSRVVHATTFRDLLERPDPPVTLLERIKDFSKASKRVSGGSLPVEVATALYYSSIVAALVRCNQKITQLDIHAICGGVEWALAQPWLDPSLRTLLLDGLEYCRKNGEHV
jgi:hypothetical protein